jgi:hypothetical protein
MLSREVELDSLAARISTRAEHRRGEEPEIQSGPWLEVQGTLTEPVKDVHEVQFSLYPEDDPRVGPARPAAIGAVIGLKPHMSVVISWSHREFDRLWGMAFAGQLRFAYLHFTKPRYGKALVVNASFSSEPEE